MDRLPDNFLVEGELSSEQIRIFLEQIDRFNELSTSYSNICGPMISDDGSIIFKKGTLIHGISGYNEIKIDNISKTGILTGQAIGKSEDGETFYCADFHRVKEDVSVLDYSLNFKANDGRCPFGSAMMNDVNNENNRRHSEYKMDISGSVAFVLTPNGVNRELLSYDCYRDGTLESDITRSFINMVPIDDKELGSSILYGVPASCLEGIIVGGKVLQDKNKIDYLIEKFPNCYLITSFGKLIYNPLKGDKLGDEMVELRRENVSLERDKRLLAREVSTIEKNLNDTKDSYDNLWYQMFYHCNSEDVANVLIALGWQGRVNAEYVDGMKKGFGR